MTNVHAGVFATGLGYKVKCTKHEFILVQHLKIATLGPDLAALHNIKTKFPWRQHQSLIHGGKSKCAWEGCQILTLGEGERKCGYNTIMRCEECSNMKENNVFF